MTENGSSPQHIKLVLLGVGSVGKSAITICFTDNKFIEEYDPTIEETYRKVCDIDGDPFMLEISDTCGADNFAPMRDLYMEQGEGFLLVYSITDTNSFNELKHTYRMLSETKDEENIPIVVIGNKCDLTDERAVATTDAQALAKQWGSYCVFFETSAKTSENVKAAFEQAAKLVLQKRGGFDKNKKRRKNWCLIL
mmetsp:Transcript_24784/g.27578  ORF Transcript_24784/g.27578 Transcript_24784/m.27578 type:complete len:195 (+) Transcript_24784:92-676(+)|eukprot:CAMPEP_0168525386 /NCGR_PEP_ID=MMETSP0405-20121227/11263_1 /TAXON_ID=498012 /ORGANISM="Trichosphaerium sp, Strain Am-I-7 wt" /LENGTH=194 /DNA_ID=CAMNT_0008547871 /DNA_START=49 /DNA_END=633 /DNA_ORIENTATION=+